MAEVEEETKTREVPPETARMNPDLYSKQSRLAIPATVKMLSGAKDNQTSADVDDATEFRKTSAEHIPGGACTQAFLGYIEQHFSGNEISPTWVEVLEGVRDTLKQKYTQIPQLSCSKMLDLKTEKFSLFNPAKGGKCKALFIGINYVGQQFELQGCANDILAMKKFVLSRGFKEEDMRVLIDDGKHTAPTMENILESIKWFVKDAGPSDSLFFHFAGHGTSERDRNGDEVDGKDETLLPVDYIQKGCIKDDTLLKELVMPLPAGCHLTCVIDACHSGSVLDLPFYIKAKGDLRNRCLEENKTFSFSKVLQLAKNMGEDANESIKEFITGFKSLIPI